MERDLSVPAPDGKDVAHTAVTTILSAIPFVGAGELFKFVVAPSLDKRREKWMQDVADAIGELQKQKGIDIESLRDNEEFISLLIQATQAAYKTHLASKHAMLKTALVNATLSEVNFDTKQYYMGLLDRLSPSHIEIIAQIDKDEELLVKPMSAGEYYDAMVENHRPLTASISVFPYLAILTELVQMGLVTVSESFVILDGPVDSPQYLATEASNSSGLPRMVVSELARHFLHVMGLIPLV